MGVGLQKILDGVGVELGGHAGIDGEGVGERGRGGARGLRGVVDDFVCELTADGFTEAQHDGLGGDHAAGQVEVAAHPSRIELETGDDQVDARQRFRGQFARVLLDVEEGGGCVVRVMFADCRFEGQRHECPYLGGHPDDVLAQLRIAFVGHCRTADRSGGDGFFDLVVFGLHELVDFAGDFAAGRGDQAEDGDELREVVADAARGHRHRGQAQVGGHGPLQGVGILTEEAEVPAAPPRRATNRRGLI